MAIAEILTIHNMLLEQIPAGVEHDSAQCPICTIEETNAPEGGVMGTYTEDEVKAKIEEAVQPLQERIAELAASKEEEAIQSRIAEAVAPLETRVSELQASLDAAVLEAQAAKDTLEASVAYLADVERQNEEGKAFAALRAERIAKVQEVASFPDEYVEGNADRWASMPEEAFDAVIEDWKLIASKKPESKKEEKIPAATAMTASQERSKSEDGMALIRDVFDMTLKGADPRTL